MFDLYFSTPSTPLTRLQKDLLSYWGQTYKIVDKRLSKLFSEEQKIAICILFVFFDKFVKTN